MLSVIIMIMIKIIITNAPLHRAKSTVIGCTSPGKKIINLIRKCLANISLPQKSTRCCFDVILHRVSKNLPPLGCYNFDAHEWILIFFGRNVTDKVGNQKTLYYATSNNLFFCTTLQNAETRNHIFHSIGLCYTHKAPVRYLPERKNVICDVFDSV